MIVFNEQPRTLIVGALDADSFSNVGADVTINAGWGNDTVVSAADNVSINAGFGNDFVFVAAGSHNTIKGFDGNDTITLGADSARNLIEYAYYDDNDLILGLRADDSIKIIGSAAANITIPGEENVRLRVDSSVVTLRGANAFNLIGTGWRDTIRNLKAGITLDAAGDNDTINNFASNVAIFGGAGNDSILINSGINSTLNGGDGDDTISLRGSGNLIDYTTGNDLVVGYRASDSIRIVDARAFTVRSANSNIFVGDASNEITLRNANVINLIGGDENNTIDNRFDNAVISGGAGDDLIIDNSARVTIMPSDGHDTVKNFSRDDTFYLGSSTIIGRRAKGKDFIVSVEGGSLTFKDVGITPIRTRDANGRLFAVNYDYSNFGDRAKMSGSGAGDSIINTGSYTSVDGGDGDDFINNYGIRVTIDGGYGNDVLENSGGGFALINGGAGNDTIINDAGNRSTLAGDWGDDRIILLGDETYATINYFAGDGCDTVDGFDRYKVIRLADATIDAHRSSGDDYVISIGDGSIRLTNVGLLPIPVLDSRGKISAVNYDISNYAVRSAVSGTADGDRIFNAASNAIVNALDGDDLLYNWGMNARFNGGAGNDTLINVERGATITGGDGDDSLIDGGAAVIRAGAGADTIMIDGGSSRIEYLAGDGDDVIVGLNSNDTIRLVDVSLVSSDYAGDDYILNVEGRTDAGSMIVKNAGLTPIRLRDMYGKTTVLNYDAVNTVSATVVSGTVEDDRIFNAAARVTVLGLEGNDTIYNSGDDATIDGGAGDDKIEIRSARSVIKYGGGADEIIGLDGDDTISIEYGDWYSTVRSGADVLVELENGSMRLRDVTDEQLNIVGGTYGRSIVNALNNKRLRGTAANDTIENSGWRVSISALDGDDHIIDSGADVTINAGDGDNVIELKSSHHVISHDGGNDTILGLDGNDTVSIEAGRAYATVRSGDDMILNAGTSTVECKGVAYRPFNVAGGVLVKGNYIVNESDGVKVDGTAGADYIWNLGGRATLEGGTGNDTFEGASGGQMYLFSSADGDNVIVNFGVDDTIKATAGKIVDVQTVGDDALVSLKGTRYEGSVLLKDAGGYRFDWNKSMLKVDPINVIVNGENGVKIYGGDGDDSIVNRGTDVTIDCGAGNDTLIGSDNAELYIFSSAYDDNVIMNFGVEDTLKCKAGTIRSVTTVGDDALVSLKGTRYEGTVLLKGAGDYRFDWNGSMLKVDPINVIVNEKNGVNIRGGNGDDSIVNHGSDVTIDCGAGNDTLIGSDNAELYLFSSAYDDNVIMNFGVDDSIKATAGKIVDVQTVGDDALVSLKGTRYEGTVLLKGAGDYNFEWSSSALKVMPHSEQGQLYQFSSADGDNVIENFGRNDTIQATAGKIVDVQTFGNDALVSLKGARYRGSVLLTGAGNYDFDWNKSLLTVIPINEIINEADGVKLIGASTADSIVNYGSGVTIQSNSGADTLTGSENGQMYLFSSADGRNVITNFGLNDTLKATAGKIVDVLTVDEDALVSLKGARYSGSVLLTGAGEYNFEWSSSMLKPSASDYWFLDESAPPDEIDLISTADDVIDHLALEEPTEFTSFDGSARSDQLSAIADRRRIK